MYVLCITQKQYAEQLLHGITLCYNCNVIAIVMHMDDFVVRY